MMFFSCEDTFKQEQVIGKYVPIGYKNTFDTIWIKADSMYLRKVYDRNNRLVLSTTQKYIFLNNNIIDFYFFFENSDRDLIQFPELLKDTLGGEQCRLEKHKSYIRFCVGLASQLHEYCYKKIK